MHDHQQQWRDIFYVYYLIKQLYLRAEEQSDQLNAYFQPLKEQKDALDHMIRAMEAHLGFKGGPQGAEGEARAGYTREHMRMCLGHLQRAFFDVAEWTALTLREEITAILCNYDTTCINKVLPEYYTAQRPAMDRAKQAIAKARLEKDGGKQYHELRQNVDAIMDALNEVIGIHQTISGAVHSLEDYKERQQRETAQKEKGKREEKRADFRKDLLKIVIGALIGAAVTWGTTQLATPAPAKNPPASPPAQAQPVPVPLPK